MTFHTAKSTGTKTEKDWRRSSFTRSTRSIRTFCNMGHRQAGPEEPRTNKSVLPQDDDPVHGTGGVSNQTGTLQPNGASQSGQERKCRRLHDTDTGAPGADAQVRDAAEFRHRVLVPPLVRGRRNGHAHKTSHLRHQSSAGKFQQPRHRLCTGTEEDINRDS